MKKSLLSFTSFQAIKNHLEEQRTEKIFSTYDKALIRTFNISIEDSEIDEKLQFAHERIVSLAKEYEVDLSKPYAFMELSVKIKSSKKGKIDFLNIDIPVKKRGAPKKWRDCMYLILYAKIHAWAKVKGTSIAEAKRQVKRHNLLPFSEYEKLDAPYSRAKKLLKEKPQYINQLNSYQKIHEEQIKKKFAFK